MFGLQIDGTQSEPRMPAQAPFVYRVHFFSTFSAHARTFWQSPCKAPSRRTLGGPRPESARKDAAAPGARIAESAADLYP